MRLSVIVTSYRSPATLLRCLDSLLTQPEAEEIVVADCSPEPPALPRDPRVRLIHHTRRMTVPKLRWSALPAVSGAIVAATEGRMIPVSDWARRLLDAHGEHPATPAIGGPVDPAPGASLFDRGLFWAEYGRFASPVADSPVRDLSGANLSFKRSALDASADIIAAGQWETHLFDRWNRAGTPPRLCGAGVQFVNGMTVATAFRQRFDYGRGYAAARGAHRFVYAAISPALPVILTARQIANASRKGRLAELAPVLPWTAMLETAWSTGEAAGYLFGPPREDVIY